MLTEFPEYGVSLSNDGVYRQGAGPSSSFDDSAACCQSDEWSHGIMSFGIVFPCTNGVIVCSDSRCRMIDGSEVTFRDDEQKIFQVPDTNILVLITGTNMFGPHEDITTADIISTLKGKTRNAIAGELVSTFLPLQFGGTVYATIIETEKQNGLFHTFIASLSIPPSGQIRIDRYHYHRATGDFYMQGAAWAMEVAKGRRFNAMPTYDAIGEMASLFQMIYRASDEFDEDKKTVGGDMDVYAVSLGKSGKLEVSHSKRQLFPDV